MPNPVSLAEPAARPGRSAESAVTVSQVTGMVKRLLERDVPALWVSGEISNWKRYGSGHAYFTLKDADAQLRCVMWSRDVERLPIEPGDGLEVLVQGQVTLYPARGEFQMNVARLEARGDGGLWKLAFEKLKRELDEAGLLDPSRRRPLPKLPRTIGIVTSAAGAALHDMLNVLRRRAPWVKVVLSPARVQGEGAADEVVAALDRLVRLGGIDVVIVGRGGGSIEDLWAFNEKVLALAVANCPIPVVSAVGHEVDWSITDYVADLRAPTPSAAAELVVPDTGALCRMVDQAPLQMERALRRMVDRPAERLESLLSRLHQAAASRRRGADHDLGSLVGRLEALSPLAQLARGYAVASRPDGGLLTSVTQVAEGDSVRVRLNDGYLDTRVERIAPITEDALTHG